MRYWCVGLPLAVLVALMPTRAEARGLESWPYDRLTREADLVVIAQPTSVADAGESWMGNPWQVEFVGVVTTFKVQATLKGKIEGDELKVLHYRLPPKVSIANGPGLVSFRLAPTSLQLSKADTKGEIKLGNDYMLFLKKGKDGRYEPVSGRIDPVLSVRELFKPLPKTFTEEKKPD
jgi:hypothetical protein